MWTGVIVVLHVGTVFSGMLRYGGYPFIKQWWIDHAKLGFFFGGGKGRYLNGTLAFTALTLNVFTSLKPVRRRSVPFRLCSAWSLRG